MSKDMNAGLGVDVEQAIGAVTASAIADLVDPPHAPASPVVGAVDIPPSETQEQRVARIRALALAAVNKESDEDMLKRFIEEERNRRREELLPKDTQGFPADYDKIEVYRGQGKYDLQYVTPGVNGLTLKIPRGEEVIIPHVFTEALDHAVEEITIQGPPGTGLITRPSHRFPYRFIGKATPDEYKAYQASQRSKRAMQEAAAASVAR